MRNEYEYGWPSEEQATWAETGDEAAAIVAEQAEWVDETEQQYAAAEQAQPEWADAPAEQPAPFDAGQGVVNAPPAAAPSQPSFMLDPAKVANLDLMMSVPMQLSVEIGRTKKTLKEILELGKDSLVVLDKQVGESVDLYVNGQYVAKGEVMVIDDHFGIRIAEILTNAEMLDKL